MKTITTIFCFYITINLYGQQNTAWHKPNWDSLQASHVGKEYMLFDVVTMDGKHINTASLKGKITWLNFWFENCHGCRGEMDKLNRLYDSLKNDPDFQFVAITFDKKETLPVTIKQYKIKYPIATLENQQEVNKLICGQGYPTNILIDKNGKIVFVRFSLTEADAKYSITLQKAYEKIAQLKEQ